MIAVGVTLPTGLGQLALLAGALVGALVAFGYGLTELRTAYRMHTTAGHTVADVANYPGPVEIEGVVSATTKALAAPFTGTDCVVYEYTIEELRRDKDGDRTWKTIDSGEKRVPFRVEDDTGSVLVEPAGATLRLEHERVVRSPVDETPPAAIGDFLSTLELGGFGIDLGRDRRYIERRIDVGEPVYVFGPARHDPTASTAAGEVNAVIGHTQERGVRERLADRLLGRTLFVLADGSETAALSRTLKSALVAGLLGVFVLVVTGVVLT
ncbi:E3 ubiquitin ligase family protein [Saliphagus infecundisoli]|uniref:RING-type E3 ubiquitin transferase n=1 Tax=Saliphagus infecundisoli TaxID=1849069 RepID=A0ABD5QBF2_9EURY|nr:E3 ubiquitin ligase family protein [Saliphagus infecundisoli]